MSYAKNKKAFTLKEVIVELAIFAILATISVAVFFGFEDTSNNKVCPSQRTSAKRMYEMYIASHEEHNVDGHCITAFTANQRRIRRNHIIITERIVRYHSSFAMSDICQYAVLDLPIAKV